jgi:polyvinyl alcohol dehydrogenase (cytochrome)
VAANRRRIWSPASPSAGWGATIPRTQPGFSRPRRTTAPRPFGVGSDRLVPAWVGIGQKSGVYWAFDEKTGNMVWNTLVGPGSALGGIEWGTAYDGQRIYVPIANSYGIRYQLEGNGQLAYGGSWAALDPATGEFDWQVPTPDGYSWARGAASAANGVVYAGSSAGAGSNNMFALDAATGNILWSFAASGSVWSAPAIADGVVYWGSGYGRFAYPNNHTFYAFSINGQ